MILCSEMQKGSRFKNMKNNGTRWQSCLLLLCAKNCFLTDLIHWNKCQKCVHLQSNKSIESQIKSQLQYMFCLLYVQEWLFKELKDRNKNSITFTLLRHVVQTFMLFWLSWKWRSIPRKRHGKKWSGKTIA